MQWLDAERVTWTPHTEALARQAIARYPDKVNGWLTLAQILRHRGEAREAADCLAEAAVLHGNVTGVHLLRARLLFQLGEDAAALRSADAAIAIFPEHRMARVLRSEIQLAAKDPATTPQALEALKAVAPEHHKLMAHYARVSSQTGRPDEFLAFCDALLESHPAHADATFYRALALARLGRTTEARQAIALNRDVQTQELLAPPGYRTAEAFRAALSDEILRNPTLVADPRGKATRNGRQTQYLHQPGSPAIDALTDQIKKAVDAFEPLCSHGAYAGAARGPKVASLRVWAVVSGAQAYQKVHRHPEGWASGVFYVSAPRATGNDRYAGSLVLGALDPVDHGIDPPWETMEIEPLPGRLVLFPSYVPHTTLPTGATGARIVVAFDVVLASRESSQPT